MRPPVKKKDRLRPPAGVEAFVRVNPFSTGSRPNNTRSQLFHRSYSIKHTYHAQAPPSSDWYPKRMYLHACTNTPSLSFEIVLLSRALSLGKVTLSLLLAGVEAFLEAGLKRLSCVPLSATLPAPAPAPSSPCCKRALRDSISRCSSRFESCVAANCISSSSTCTRA